MVKPLLEGDFVGDKEGFLIGSSWDFFFHFLCSLKQRGIQGRGGRWPNGQWDR